MERYAAGIDIGGTSVKTGLFNEQGELLENWQIPTMLDNQGTLILPTIADFLKQKLSSKGLALSGLKGIGIGVPGPVLAGGFVPLAVNLGWKNVNIKEEMRKLTGIPVVFVENDAKAAALGEYWKGGWERYRSAVMVTLGTAVGGAVILDGKIVSGAFGAAGELSHIQVDPQETEPCACGKYGHLQQYVSAGGILRNIREKLRDESRVSVLRTLSELTVKDVFEAAKEGDGPALETFHETVRILARALATVSCVIDPELYLIGGGIAKAGDFLLSAMREEFRKTALTISEGVRIEAARMGNDAGIYGAVRPVIHHSI